MAIAAGRSPSKKAATSASLAEYGSPRRRSTAPPPSAVAAAQALAGSTDFERYQLRVAKRSRAHWSRKIFAEKDAKQSISWHSKLAAKMEKTNKKIAGKKTAKK